VIQQHALSRRSALGLTIGVAAALTTLPAQAHAQAAPPPSDGRQQKYIFGYGSLIERESRMGTWPDAEFASPAIVNGLARGWFDQTDVPSWIPTYVGGVADTTATCNGMIVPVTAAEFDTSHWGTPWVNDRVYPWRPFVSVPRASAIDALIQKVLGQDMFAQIRLP
jgi:hypothetical protein